MKKVTAAALLVTILVVIFATSCGKGASDNATERQDVTLDAKTEASVATVIINGDSFTLPCAVSEFIEKGYVWSYYEKLVDTDGIMLSGRSKMGDFTISKDDGRPTLVGVINNDAESKPISDCVVYCIKYTNWNLDDSHDKQNTDWEYMGITWKSNREDILTAFEGILEFENDQYASEDKAGVQYTDAYRNIYFDYDTEDDCICSMGVIIYPNKDGWEYDHLYIS